MGIDLLRLNERHYISGEVIDLFLPTRRLDIAWDSRFRIVVTGILICLKVGAFDYWSRRLYERFEASNSESQTRDLDQFHAPRGIPRGCIFIRGSMTQSHDCRDPDVLGLEGILCKHSASPFPLLISLKKPLTPEPADRRR